MRRTPGELNEQDEMIHRTEPNDEYQDSPLEQLGYEMQYGNGHLMNRADNLGKKPTTLKSYIKIMRIDCTR